ncbi:MAG TPA: urea ABC transporter substrate-binding protein [Holosporales bacterium]|nr:urea ABC transporter substrate-binding protein [Holosporales bacterium]
MSVKVKGFLLGLIFALLSIPAFLFFYKPYVQPIKVGILHSLTGTMALSEVSVKNATLMAIEEINAQGGVLGRSLEPVIFDGASEASVFMEGAEKLITQDDVSVVFGCWTSASRRSVKPIFEKHKNLLFYPVQYEGVEQSPHIIYTGSVPNQQIIPGIFWAFKNLGQRFFIVGSDYIFPRVASEIIKEQIKSIGGEFAGEAYIPLGEKNVQGVIDQLIAAKPTVILNLINGDTNIAFFQLLREKGIMPSQIPTMSFSIGEQELLSLDLKSMIGDYAVWSYFQSINSHTNADFIVKFQRRFPGKVVITDPMEAAYFGVHLWAKAAQKAGTANPQVVLQFIEQNFPAPEGVVYLDSQNHHTWKFARIGKIRFDGQFAIIWDSNHQVKPEPYLPIKSKKQWDAFVQKLYLGWGKKWEK